MTDNTMAELREALRLISEGTLDERVNYVSDGGYMRYPSGNDDIAVLRDYIKDLKTIARIALAKTESGSNAR